MNELNRRKLTGLIGLAQRAGKLISGEAQIDRAAKASQVRLLLIAEDVSAATRKNYGDMARYYKLNVQFVFSKVELGGCIGKNERAAIAVLDSGLAGGMLKLLAAE